MKKPMYQQVEYWLNTNEALNHPEAPLFVIMVAAVIWLWVVLPLYIYHVLTPRRWCP